MRASANTWATGASEGGAGGPTTYRKGEDYLCTVTLHLSKDQEKNILTNLFPLCRLHPAVYLFIRTEIEIAKK